MIGDPITDWIPHDGKSMPVEWPTFGQVQFRDGSETRPGEIAIRTTRWAWRPNPTPADVVAYRRCKQTNE